MRLNKHLKRKAHAHNPEISILTCVSQRKTVSYLGTRYCSSLFNQLNLEKFKLLFVTPTPPRRPKRPEKSAMDEAVPLTRRLQCRASHSPRAESNTLIALMTIDLSSCVNSIVLQRKQLNAKS